MCDTSYTKLDPEMVLFQSDALIQTQPFLANSHLDVFPTYFSANDRLCLAVRVCMVSLCVFTLVLL